MNTVAYGFGVGPGTGGSVIRIVYDAGKIILVTQPVKTTIVTKAIKTVVVTPLIQ